MVDFKSVYSGAGAMPGTGPRVIRVMPYDILSGADKAYTVKPSATVTPGVTAAAPAAPRVKSRTGHGGSRVDDPSGAIGAASKPRIKAGIGGGTPVSDFFGDTAYGITQVPDNAGPIGSFAAGFAGARANRAAREKAASDAAIAAEDKAYQRALDARKLDLAERTGEADISYKEAQAKKLVDEQGDITQSTFAQINNLAYQHANTLISALNNAKDENGNPLSQEEKDKRIADINASIPEWQTSIEANIRKGLAMNDADADAAKKLPTVEEVTTPAPAPEAPEAPAAAAPAATATPAPASTAPAAPAPAAPAAAGPEVKARPTAPIGEGTVAAPYNGYRTTDEFLNKVQEFKKAHPGQQFYYIDETNKLQQFNAPNVTAPAGG